MERIAGYLEVRHLGVGDLHALSVSPLVERTFNLASWPHARAVRTAAIGRDREFAGLRISRLPQALESGAGPRRPVQVWKDPRLDAKVVCIPDPGLGELFTGIHVQIHSLVADGSPNPAEPRMGGLVDNYMRQPSATPATDPYPIVHYFTPDQMSVISTPARAFGVSDRWRTSAPCRLRPDRFFAHTGGTNGSVKNSLTHFPEHLAENRPTVYLDHMAQNLIRLAPGKTSRRQKRKAAGWNDDFMAKPITR